MIYYHNKTFIYVLSLAFFSPSFLLFFVLIFVCTFTTYSSYTFTAFLSYLTSLHPFFLPSFHFFSFPTLISSTVYLLFHLYSSLLSQLLNTYQRLYNLTHTHFITISPPLTSIHPSSSSTSSIHSLLFPKYPPISLSLVPSITSILSFFLSPKHNLSPFRLLSSPYLHPLSPSFPHT